MISPVLSVYILKPKPTILFTSLLLLVGGSIAFWWSADVQQPKVASTPPPIEVAPEPAVPALHEDTAAFRKAASVPDAKQSEKAARAAIQTMMERLWRVPPAQLDRIVRAYLASGEDAPTGLRFDIGTDGSITDPPSMRVALLDLLSRLAPGQAVVLGKELVQTATNPDEWAAALRCAAILYDPDETPQADHDFLVSQVSRRLGQSDWLRDPSAGFLCAFDAASLLASPDLYTKLAAIHADATLPPHTHDAASLALRDAAQNFPVTTPSFVLKNPALFASEPVFRGALLSSADVREAAMQTALLSHLAAPSTPDAELRAFLVRFPQTNWVAGVRLFSSSVKPAIPAESKAEQFTASLSVLNALLAQRADLSPETRTLLEKKTSITQARLTEINTAQR